MKKCKHNLVQEMEWRHPNFWGQLVGEKSKKVPTGDGYLVCTKCGARVLSVGGMAFSSEAGTPGTIKAGVESVIDGELCTECDRRFPEDLLLPVNSGEGARLICPICALKMRNEQHGLPKGTPFTGEQLVYYKKAIEYRKKVGSPAKVKSGI